MAQHTLSAQDSDSHVDARVGDTLVISLPENPTTGFRWEVDKVDEPVLTVPSLDFTPPGGGGIGSGGQRTVTVAANQAGDGQLQLKLRRQWEGDKSISQRFTVNVHVAS